MQLAPPRFWLWSKQACHFHLPAFQRLRRPAIHLPATTSVLAICLTLLAASPAAGQDRTGVRRGPASSDVGAADVEWIGDSFVFYDVWEEVQKQRWTCGSDGLLDAQKKAEACRRRFWERYDPDGRRRGLDYTREDCLAEGDRSKAECTRRVKDYHDRKRKAFLTECFRNDRCKRAWDDCGMIIEDCKERYTVWNYYRRRKFEVPCQPFAKMTWEDKQWPKRNDWDTRWGHVYRLDRTGSYLKERGFTGDPSAWRNIAGIAGSPMWVRPTRRATSNLGHRPKIGSYFFVDLRYGRLSFSAKRPGEATYTAKVSLPYDFKYADGRYDKFSWTRHLYLCEATFTRKEVENIQRGWGLVPEEQSGAP